MENPATPAKMDFPLLSVPPVSFLTLIGECELKVQDALYVMEHIEMVRAKKVEEEERRAAGLVAVMVITTVLFVWVKWSFKADRR